MPPRPDLCSGQCSRRALSVMAKHGTRAVDIRPFPGTAKRSARQRGGRLATWVASQLRTPLVLYNFLQLAVPSGVRPGMVASRNSHHRPLVGPFFSCSISDLAQWTTVSGLGLTAPLVPRAGPLRAHSSQADAWPGSRRSFSPSAASVDKTDRRSRETARLLSAALLSTMETNAKGRGNVGSRQADLSLQRPPAAI